ncbi:hypothetical protein MHYP_G00354890 [Metynnis hypsauchen]
MPFGINPASEVFQRSMEHLFAGEPCSVIFDDIIVGGRGVAEHDANLRRAREVNLRLNPDKYTETQYAQIEKELLAVVVTCTKFKDYKDWKAHNRENRQPASGNYPEEAYSCRPCSPPKNVAPAAEL